MIPPSSTTAAMLDQGAQLAGSSLRGHKRIVALDFDGPVHSYVSPWTTAEKIADAPTIGAKEAIEFMRSSGFEIWIHSSRCKSTSGMVAISEWLKKHEIEVDGITATKPPAFVTIDDRCLSFEGNWFNTLEALRKYKAVKNASMTRKAAQIIIDSIRGLKLTLQLNRRWKRSFPDSK